MNCATIEFTLNKMSNSWSLAGALCKAIEECNLRRILTLLERHANPNIILPETGIAPMHFVLGCEDGMFTEKAVTLFLNNGGDPNVYSVDYITPVAITCIWGKLKLLTILLDHGGNPWLADNEKKNAFDYSLEHGHTDCWNYLCRFTKLYANLGFTPDSHLNEGAIRIAGLEKELPFGADFCCSNGLCKKGLCDENPELDDTTRNQVYQLILEYRRNPCSTERISGDLVDLLKFSVLSGESNNGSDGADKYNRVIRRLMCTSPIGSRKKKNTPPENSADVNIEKASRMPSSSTPRRGSIFTEESDSEDSVVVISDDESDNSSGTFHSAQENLLPPPRNEVAECISLLDSLSMSHTSKFPEPTRKENMDDVATESSKHNKGFIQATTVLEETYYTDLEEDVVLIQRTFIPDKGRTTGQSDSDSSRQSTLSKVSEGGYNTDCMREELRRNGVQFGPITKTTKRVYVRLLRRIRKDANYRLFEDVKEFSPVLHLTISDRCEQILKEWSHFEDSLIDDFSNTNRRKVQRGGLEKSFFNYLLLDPRRTKNLPLFAYTESLADVWKAFLLSIFYIGKGKNSRPYAHLYEALKPPKGGNKKVELIKTIWNEQLGIVCIHVFHNVTNNEALTREAAMIDAILKRNLTNAKSGEYHGVASTWNSRQKAQLGSVLLYRALRVYLAEGERQLFPADLPKR